MSPSIEWRKSDKLSESLKGVNECLETITKEDERLIYLNMGRKEHGVDSFSMFYISKDKVLATFCDGEIKIPTGMDIRQPTSKFIVRGMSEKDLANELANIGEGIERLLPYFVKIKTDVPTFEKEISILKGLVDNVDNYRAGNFNNGSFPKVWYYW